MCAGPPISTPCPRRRRPSGDIQGARALARLANSVTTDHISPAGNIRKDGPAGAWLIEHGVAPGDFNSYGSRRGNHEVMVRGTFANVRLRNQLAPGTEGGLTTYFPIGRADDDLRRRHALHRGGHAPGGTGRPGVRLGVFPGLGGQGHGPAGRAGRAGRELRAHPPVQPHRNGVLPLQFLPGESASSLGLTGEEVFDITGLEGSADGPLALPPVRQGRRREPSRWSLRIDTPVEADYYRHGGILPYVLRQLRRRSADRGLGRPGTAGSAASVSLSGLAQVGFGGRDIAGDDALQHADEGARRGARAAAFADGQAHVAQG